MERQKTLFAVSETFTARPNAFAFSAKEQAENL